MTTQSSFEEPKAGFFKNLKIGSKLMVGFGMLVMITLIAIGFSYFGSIRATSKINTTAGLRSPTALASARAQANLLRILADVRGYIALGDPNFQEQYWQDRTAFEQDLKELQRLSANFSAENKAQFIALKATFKEWVESQEYNPERLFELRDDQFDREPAYRLLMTDGSQLAGRILIDINTLIETQGKRTPTAENLEMLEDMAKFQGSFAAMFSALRGYVTTRNRIYRQEFDVNKTINDNHWERLWSKQGRIVDGKFLNLNRIKLYRARFLEGIKVTKESSEYLNSENLPDSIVEQLKNFEDQEPQLERNFLNMLEKTIGAELTMTYQEVILTHPKFIDFIFEILESDRWREDLYLFKTETIPRTEKMQQLLKSLTEEQQHLLQADLNTGRQELVYTNLRTLISGVAACILGLGLAFLFRGNIAGPVRRLTGVAEQIREGDLDAQARVESKDEIGTLAETFNNMTTQLRQTLSQVRKEKKRADDLLEVVIPIGVELSSEKDFYRLLEKMLLEAKSFCHADAGTLYLKTEDEQLKFMIVRTDSKNIAMGGTTGNEVTFAPLALKGQDAMESGHCYIATQVALNGVSQNIAELNRPSEILSDYQVISLLTIPLKNTLGQVKGVLQLLNAQEPESHEIIPFDQNLQQMMESFSSLAVAALEAYIREQNLKNEIKLLRIEIDEVKRQKQVRAITETESFQNLQAKAAEMRRRRKAGRKKNIPKDTPPS